MLGIRGRCLGEGISVYRFETGSMDLQLPANSLAFSLSPVLSKIPHPGPTTTAPASSHILFANTADSERKP